MRGTGLITEEQQTLQITPTHLALETVENIDSIPAYTNLGQFRILRLLGSGGMGEVWLAEQTKPVQREVAIKFLKSIRHFEHSERLQLERQILARLNHPHIAKLFEANTTPNGMPYFVMEYVDGLPLLRYCDENQLSIRERILLFRKILDAVAYSHQKGIIHRDLKPGNILITKTEQGPHPKVIDFGLAKSIGERISPNEMLTLAGEVFGTPGYMSPEQADPGSSDIDTRCDVYSLGAVLYELLVGGVPHGESLRSSTFLEVLQTLKSVDPTLPSQKLSKEPDRQRIAQQRHTTVKDLIQILKGDLDAIVLKALEKNREDRYATIQAFNDDLGRFLDDQPISIPAPSRWYYSKKFIRRNRQPVLFGLLILGLLCGGLLGTTWGWLQARRAEKQAQLAQVRVANEADGTQKLNQFLLKFLLGEGDVHTSVSFEKLPNRNMRQILDEAANAVPHSFQNQPLIESTVRYALGRGYLTLGDYHAAEEQLTQVYQFLHQDQKQDTLALIRVERELGTIYRELGKLEKAETYFQSVLHRANLEPNVAAKDKRHYQNDYAVLLEKMDRLDQASQIYHQLLEENDLEFGLRISVSNNLAVILHKQQKVDQAIRLLESLFDCSEFQQPSYAGSLLNVKNSLAVFYRNTNRSKEAAPLFEEVYKQRLQTLGVGHPDTINSMNSLAILYIDQQKYDLAEPMLREAVRHSQKLLGNAHPDTLIRLGNLSHCLEKRGQLEEAEDFAIQHFQHSLPLKESRPLQYASSAMQLVSLRLLRGKYADALPIAEEVLQVRRKLLPANDWAVANTESVLGEIYWKCGQGDKAELLLKEGFFVLHDPACKIPLPAKHRKTEAKQRLYRFLEQLQKPDELAALQKQYGR